MHLSVLLIQFLSTYLVCQKAVYSFVHFTTLNANSRFLYHELNTEKELLKAEKDLLEKNSPATQWLLIVVAELHLFSYTEKKF